MLFLKSCLLVAAFSHTATAFFRWYPDYRCAEFGTCTSDPKRRAMDADVKGRTSEHTVEIVQRIPSSTQPHDVQIRKLAERLAHKYQRGTLIQSTTATAAEDHMEKRANNYKIVTAAVPTTETSVGIDQDGTDYSYFAKVKLGSNGTVMNMLLDTGAGTSWVMGHDCESVPCKRHNNFGAIDSTTFKSKDVEFELHYGSGNVSGIMATDTLSIAGFTLQPTFGIAKVASDDFKNFPIDGILGLAQSKGPHATFIETLVTAKLLKANLFGVSISRSTDGPNTGVLNFGAPDTTRFVGALAYTAVQGPEKNDWAIPMEGISFDGKKADIQFKLAYIDTGTSYIFSKKEEVKRLHDTIPGATSGDDITWKVPCTTTIPLTFTFGGNSYSISARDWVGPNVKGQCTSNIYGHDVVGDAWLLGDTFLKNVYAVFDIDGNRIGFGSRPAPPAPVVTSTSTGGPSSSTVQPNSGVPAKTGPSGTVESSNALPIGSPATKTSNAAEATGTTATTPPGMGGREGASGTSGAAAVQSSATPAGLNNSQSPANRLDNNLVSAALAILGLFTLIS